MQTEAVCCKMLKKLFARVCATFCRNFSRCGWLQVLALLIPLSHNHNYDCSVSVCSSFMLPGLWQTIHPQLADASVTLSPFR